MAENKKSVIVYAEWLELFEFLSDEEAGQLIKHFFRYVNDLDPIAPNRFIEGQFLLIKQALKRDLDKWENKIENRSFNGKLGNLKKYHPDLYEKVKSDEIDIFDAEEIAKSRKTSHSDSNASQNIAKLAVNVNDNVNVNDIIINKRFFDSCMDSQEWIEQTAMASKPKFTPAEVIELLKKFQKDTELNADVKINANEYRSHFRRWLDKQTKIHVEFYDLPLAELTDYIARVVIDEKLYNGFSEVPPELKGYFDKMCKRLAQFIKANIDTVKNKSIADIMALEKKSNIGKL